MEKKELKMAGRNGKLGVFCHPKPIIEIQSSSHSIVKLVIMATEAMVIPPTKSFHHTMLTLMPHSASERLSSRRAASQMLANAPIHGATVGTILKLLCQRALKPMESIPTMK